MATKLGSYGGSPHFWQFPLSFIYGSLVVYYRSDLVVEYINLRCFKFRQKHRVSNINVCRTVVTKHARSPGNGAGMTQGRSELEKI